MGATMSISLPAGSSTPPNTPAGRQPPYGWTPPPPPSGYAPVPPGWWTPGPPPQRRTYWLVGIAIALTLSVAFAAIMVTQAGANGSVTATERAVVDINAQLDTGEAVAGTGMVI